PFETLLNVAGEQIVPVDGNLRPLDRSGRLTGTEQGGAVADGLVDNVVVGKTPWLGAGAGGGHNVRLRGEGRMGTQPAMASVRVNEVTALTLPLESLEADLRLEPTPAGATIAIDGVPVGSGVWDGRLKPGSHTVDVRADGFFPFS